MRLIDTHCHLGFKAYKDDIDDVVQHALDDDIWMVVPGSQRDTSKRSVELAEKHDEGVYAAVGLHPAHVHSFTYDDTVGEEKIKFVTREEEFDADFYRQLAKSDKVVALGEMGIDNYIASNFEDSDKALQDQIDVFEAQLDLADELDLPVIVHARESTDIIQGILKKRYPNGRQAGGVAHFFSDGIEEAQAYFDLGFLISFTGVITFAKAYHDVIKQVPLDKIMVETDAPYVTPHPHRGTRNEPSYVKFTAQKIADLKNLSLEDVAKQTTANARTLFGLDQA